ncbi:type IV pilus biogenesis protein PilP [Acetobacter okinawensis]|uniref:type IV pilus biogenesis protein PilP n=1 Tax=Acetobacter okinawensis TaxID=1076594 RepID=UPI001BA572EA|nr:type IV pilus biogenesis protein PilP [Acetobacter okinawensis]MBS0987404.1 type IV pilus biogenesis protein PilP [Acetobacter okinawensis]
MTRMIYRSVGLGAVLFFGMTTGSQAAVSADCADHLISPAQGHELTPQAIDSNAACVMFMQQAATVAELKAKIAESEKRMKREDKAQSNHPERTALTEALHPTQTVMQQPVHDNTPRIEEIFEDARHRMGATLSFPDGGFMTVTVGTRLPDGSVVQRVRGPATGNSGVDVLKDGQTITLLMDNGADKSEGQAASRYSGQRTILPNPSVPLIPSLPSPPGTGN